MEDNRSPYRIVVALVFIIPAIIYGTFKYYKNEKLIEKLNNEYSKLTLRDTINSKVKQVVTLPILRNNEDYVILELEDGTKTEFFARNVNPTGNSLEKSISNGVKLTKYMTDSIIYVENSVKTDTFVMSYDE